MGKAHGISCHKLHQPTHEGKSTWNLMPQTTSTDSWREKHMEFHATNYIHWLMTGKAHGISCHKLHPPTHDGKNTWNLMPQTTSSDSWWKKHMESHATFLISSATGQDVDCLDKLLSGVGVTKPISSNPLSSRFFFFFCHFETMTFHRCLHSSAAVRPMKYEIDSKNLTVPIINKSTNRTWSTWG